jgi:hypothetical protein
MPSFVKCLWLDFRVNLVFWKNHYLYSTPSLQSSTFSSPPYPWVQHLWTQLTAHQNYLENNYIYMEHVQFFLVIYSLYNIIIYIAFTLYYIYYNLGIMWISHEDVHKLNENTMPFYIRNWTSMYFDIQGGILEPMPHGHWGMPVLCSHSSYFFR